ncbi:FIG00003370: Multicopper polyphenol oxidase [hydrothermal vent metagenome]|uniref:FIG00003370: Multicopper polyphenol oxidase n=1 Tax=hydrothermal vent metagenome TaxID=652676 RepID=A0A3B0YN26_9ZZZZ
MIRPDWPAPASVQAATTTRCEGISAGSWASLNLADHVGDEAQAVQENRNILYRMLGLPAEPEWMRQVHGNRVVEVRAGEKHAGSGSQIKPQEADASVARAPDRVSVVLTADCLPALFCDLAGRCVASAHAGWRGLASGVLEATVQAMRVDPGELLVWLGPAIGPQAFEVGDEVRAVFVEQHPQAAEAFVPGPRQRLLADLYQLARIRLSAIGVQAVYGGDRCTFSEADTFYSYRRDGTTGRMASLIWLR